MKYDLKTCIWNIIDLLFPPHCAGCKKWGVRICNACLNTIEIISGPICLCCGYPVPSGVLNCCSRCKSSNIYYDNVRSWAYFNGVLQKTIHKLKYRRDLRLSESLSLPMITLLQEQSWIIDLIIPVPLDPERMKERGYNQAALLAKPISRCTGILFDGNILYRTKKTRSQVGLTIIERKENVKGAFEAKSSKVCGKSILLIDDVVTTGSTLNSCANALKKAGARNIYGLTPARSLRL